MLTAELNEKLSRVGPGTPGGELLRRYWHPVAAVAEIAKRPTKKVRILGEDLVLYRDKSGQLGLIGERCPHRRASMYYGVPEENGLRCAYHGWCFDRQGTCLETPPEPPESSFKDRVRLPAYPVQELGGLIFAYLGPEPAPLLPRYDAFVAPNAIRQIGAAVVPCNWVQIMENSFDQTHVEWLHGHYANYVLAQEAEALEETFTPRPRRQHTKIGFDVFEHGIVKRRMEEGGTEEDDDWKIGHAVVFPNILANPTMQIRVPMDDTHTWHVWYTATELGVPAPAQDVVPFFDMRWQAEDGEFITNFVDGQDIMAWVTQGEVAERHLERLGASDVGIILFRQLLQEQIEAVEQGKDPMAVIRDASRNDVIRLPRERVHHGRPRGTEVVDGRRRGGRPNSQEYDMLMKLMRARAASEGASLLPPDQPPVLVESLKSVTANLVSKGIERVG